MDPQQQAIAEEFDRYNESYDDAVNRAISFSGQKVESFTRAKADDLLRTIASHFESPRRLNLLDVGCGIGNYHPLLAPVVGSVSGVDVSGACIAKAKERNPAVSYAAYDGDHLPYPDRQFDVTFCICVLHHVPSERWPQFIGEMHRVTRAGSRGLRTQPEESADAQGRARLRIRSRRRPSDHEADAPALEQRGLLGCYGELDSDLAADRRFH
jgi:ubiquinone/menaquinone biosynthesis C-methylase UbiE